MQSGTFVVSKGKECINAVATDMALQQTYNKDVTESTTCLTGMTIDDKAI